MEITLQKHLGKRSVLNCKRSDGSVTWAKLHPGTETHDLAHYAVESILGFQDAFYGLLEQGYHIADFELPKGERPTALEPANLPPAALQTEHLVNLLQIEHFNSQVETPLLDQLNDILSNHKIPFPENLTLERLEQIRNLFNELVQQWKQLAPGQYMELTLEFR